MANMTKGERRDQKASRRWYKRHLHNNRKAIALIQEARHTRDMATLAGGKAIN